MLHKRFHLLLFSLALLTIVTACGREEKFFPAKQRDGKLLCAVNVAERINAKGEVSKEEPYWSGVGFTNEPTVIVAGNSGIFGCLIGTTSEGIVVAFRGVSPPPEVNAISFTDWINNLIGLEPIHVPGLVGRVHPKSWKGVEELWAKVNAEIGKRKKAEGEKAKILFTGHGKGGAIAILFAVRMKAEGMPSPKEIVTFGAHLSGDQQFADKDMEGIALLKYVVEGDIVPLLPPDEAFIVMSQRAADFQQVFDRASGWNYNEFGKEKFISVSKGGDETPALVRVKARKEALIQLIQSGEPGMKAIVASHDCGCKSGYWKLLVNDIVCRAKTTE
jgi:Lipase (class 3)